MCRPFEESGAARGGATASIVRKPQPSQPCRLWVEQVTRTEGINRNSTGPLPISGLVRNFHQSFSK